MNTYKEVREAHRDLLECIIWNEGTGSCQQAVEMLAELDELERTITDKGEQK